MLPASLFSDFTMLLPTSLRISCVFVIISFGFGQCEDLYCTAVAKCLDQVADKLMKCNRESETTHVVEELENVTACQLEMRRGQASLSELHEDQARMMAKCIYSYEMDLNFTCPLIGLRRSKRTPSLIEPVSPLLDKALSKVFDECHNSKELINGARIRLRNGQLRNRLQMVDYVKTTCNGNSSLNVEDLPDLEEAKLEQLYAKIARECVNFTDITATLLTRHIQRQIYTRFEVIEYVRSTCGNGSTIDLSDLPEPVDEKLELTMWKIQQNCTNAEQLFGTLLNEQLRDNFTLIHDPLALIEFFDSQCDGSIRLSPDDFSSIQDNTTGDSSEQQHANGLTVKLRDAYARIEQRCANGSQIVEELRAMFENGEIETTEDMADFVDMRCDGRVNMTVDDFPMVGCHTMVKKMLTKCLLAMDKCPVARRCQQCLEKSSMGEAILRERKMLDSLSRTCVSVSWL